MKKIAIILLLLLPSLAFASEGALVGEFSVSATLKVHFSRGNLQYQASTQTWRFALHQYDYIGSANKNISSTYTGWIDLFGWGTSGYSQQPYATDDNYHKYPCNTTSGCLTTNISGTDHDWGRYNKISNGGNVAARWRILTYAEWNYLLNSRSNAAQRKGFAVVNGKTGLVLLPDIWTLPAGCNFVPGVGSSINLTTNTYNVSQWTLMENAGAIFLPIAGCRQGTSVSTSLGHYWTGTVCPSSEYANYWLYAGHLSFNSSGTTVMLYTTYSNASFEIKRYYGASVRLVQNSSVYNANTYTITTSATNGTVTGGGTYDKNASATLTATPNSCYRFVRWSDNNTNNPRTVTVTGNATYTAIFEKVKYTIRTESDNISQGKTKVEK